jgi:D-alanyl-D-alanine carboxypeptidase/D-alanyl-D-alanine-endopeptidase (penicillin-binding protein 4)
MNAGSSNIEGFRNQQDRVLQALDQHWQILPEATQGSIPERSFLGDPSRISQGF